MAARNVIGLLLLAFGTASAGSCPGNYYRELNCKAVGGGMCPAAYQCPEWYPTTNQCYYKGRAFNVDEKVPDNLATDMPCFFQCRCVGRQEEAEWMPSFECAAVDCAMDYAFYSNVEEKCTEYEKISDCCPSRVCGEDIAKLVTCSLDGQVYKEGQTMYPPNTCQQCECKKDFNGTSGESVCAEVRCGIELNEQDSLIRKCAPMLNSWEDCCPEYFICPDISTKVILAKEESNIEQTCAFGNFTLKVGDKATVSDRCVNCKCIIPPLLSCVLEKDCASNKLD